MKRIVRAITAAVVATAAVALTVGGGTAGAGEERHGKGHYASINGLRMYYEVHGKRNGKPPVVLIHGGFSATGTSWGELIRPLARTRQVISVEQQAHGRTADIDRPLRAELMADDTAALLDRLGVRRADVWGYSMGAAVALNMGLSHPEKVNKLVLQSIGTNVAGYHPGQREAMEHVQPEHFYGTVFHDEYMRIAPRPEDFPTLVAKVKDLVITARDIPAEEIAAMDIPVLSIWGDSDIFRPEHSIEVFRATGGGVNGDVVGLPDSQLAILPGTTHIGTTERGQLLLSIGTAFLDGRPHN